MLLITIPSTELWDEKSMQFLGTDETVLELEHSLASIQQWESKWNVPFLSKKELTREQVIDYVQCMTLNRVNPEVYNFLTNDNLSKIEEYIKAPMTATTFSNDKSSKGGREVITSELIYYWMTSLNIPSEYRYWHFNQLLTLIRVCSIKNSPPKKRSSRDIMQSNAALNAARRKQFNSKG